MAFRPSDPCIAAHIESISARAEIDTERLMAVMLRRCWPGGSSDRSEPVALEWVRRWGPRQLACVLPACSCGAGHCLLCN